MQTFFSEQLGLNVVTRKGDEVFLPDDNAVVAVTYFEGTGLFEVMADGIRRRGQPLCVRTESLIAAFSESETPQGRTKPNKKSKPEDHPQNSTNAAETNVQAEVNGGYGNDEKPTADTVRSYKSLQRSWKATRDKLLSSAIPANTVGVSVRPPEKMNFDRMNKLLPRFARYVKEKYPLEFKGCGVFPEPDEAGDGWHAHLFPHFRNGIPTDFENVAFKWWARQSEVEILNNDFLLKFEYFATKQQLVTALDYVNPTRGKKRKLIPLYPSRRQTMRYFGEYTKPVTAAAPFKVVRELAGAELTSLRRSTEFTDPCSGEVIFSRTTLIFDVGRTFLERLREHQNADFEALIFISDECSRCCRGEPHEFSPEFCSGCDRFVKYDSA